MFSARWESLPHSGLRLLRRVLKQADGGPTGYQVPGLVGQLTTVMLAIAGVAIVSSIGAIVAIAFMSVVGIVALVIDIGAMVHVQAARQGLLRQGGAARPPTAPPPPPLPGA